MSFYKDYLEEITNDKVIETEKGFVVYEVNQDNIYVKDIYIAPEFRKAGVASKLVDEIAAIAVSKGIKRLLGSIRPSNKFTTEYLIAHIHYGFKIVSSTDNFIVLQKDL